MNRWKQYSIEPGVTIDQYNFQDEIYRSDTSRIFLVKSSTNPDQLCAKIYRLSYLYKETLGNIKPPIDSLKTEEVVADRLSSHPNILKSVDFFTDKKFDAYVVVYPYASYGNLRNFIISKGINQFANNSILKCFYQIAGALHACHSFNIVHRDVKPENIFIFNENSFVLGDFTIARELKENEEKIRETCGTPPYLAPEVCSGKPFDPKKADVWAFGVSFYFSLYEKLPFNLDTVTATVYGAVYAVEQALAANQLDFPPEKPISPELLHLLQILLVKDPEKRPRFDEILKNPVFREFSGQK